MSKYDPFKHHRRSIRLPNFDYTQAGAYFITICVQYGECVLGEVVNGVMVLSEWGQIVEAAWWETGELRDHVALDTHQVMPNHFHGLLWLLETPHFVGAQRAAPLQNDAAPLPPPLQEVTGLNINVQPKSLGAVVRGFKSAATNAINQERDAIGAPFWQRNYYDQIIRDEAHLTAVRQYILNNPAHWEADKLHPNAPPNKFNEEWRKKGGG